MHTSSCVLKVNRGLSSLLPLLEGHRCHYGGSTLLTQLPTPLLQGLGLLCVHMQFIRDSVHLYEFWGDINIQSIALTPLLPGGDAYPPEHIPSTRAPDHTSLAKPLSGDIAVGSISLTHPHKP